MVALKKRNRFNLKKVNIKTRDRLSLALVYKDGLKTTLEEILKRRR